MKIKIITILSSVFIIMNSFICYAQINGYKTLDNTISFNLSVNETSTQKKDNNDMQITINNISLKVFSNGIINRMLNGVKSSFSYNEQYNSNVTFLKLFNWNNSFTALVYDNDLGIKKIITSGLGNVWQDVEYTTFAESDIDFKYGMEFNINDVDVYGDQMYVACDKGLIIVLTPCMKCYKLKKVSDKDLKTIVFEDGIIKINKYTDNYFEIPISSVRQNNITVDEAVNLHARGALLVDVREKEDYEAEHYYNSINIPLSDIYKLSEYDRNSCIIFFCKSGTRAEKALQEAQKMGFINVYNLGSVDLLLN